MKNIFLILFLLGNFLFFNLPKEVLAVCPGNSIPYTKGKCTNTKIPNTGEWVGICTTVWSSATCSVDTVDGCAAIIPVISCRYLSSGLCTTDTASGHQEACCTKIDGINGSCGSSNGGTFTVAPFSGLCSAGWVSWIDQIGTDGVYNWRCGGTLGSCGGAIGTPVNCWANNDSAPSFSSLILKTYDGDIVTAETGSRNQICQSIFKQDTVNPNGVQFVVTGADTQGIGDIGTMQVRLKNISNIYTFDPVASINGVATISVDLNASGVIDGTYNIEVLINDIGGILNSGWIDTGRDFKNWNCEVTVSGGFYDGSAGENCPNFNTNFATNINFSSLSFTSPSSGLSSIMSVSNNTYTSGSNPLIWGTSSYQAIFNNNLAVSDKSLRLVDIGIGTTSCSSTLNFDLDSNIVDPYVATPILRADFSGTISQNGWFQTIDGGVLGKSTISNFVPTTCGLAINGCVEATAIRGLVAAPSINGFANVDYSSPDNWYSNQDLISKINFFEKYKKITGIGTTLIEGDLSDSSVINNTDGLLMVNGDVNITQNKTTVVGNFSMIVASGDIIIDPSVSQFDGILVASNIDIGGSSAAQLTINGSLYGTDQVSITRSYIDKMDNNDAPAVLVRFRPDFIFNMPSSMAKNVVEWRWGN